MAAEAIHTGNTKIEVAIVASNDRECQQAIDALRLAGAGELLVYAVGRWTVQSEGAKVFDFSLQDKVEVDWDTLNDRKVHTLVDISKNISGLETYGRRDWRDARSLSRKGEIRYHLRATLYGAHTVGFIGN